MSLWYILRHFERLEHRGNTANFAILKINELNTQEFLIEVTPYTASKNIASLE
jgi:hypothetical protein